MEDLEELAGGREGEDDRPGSGGGGEDCRVEGKMLEEGDPEW
jgi:hypothetical protein